MGSDAGGPTRNEKAFALFFILLGRTSSILFNASVAALDNGASTDLINKKFISYPKGLEKYVYPGSSLLKNAFPLKSFLGLIYLPSGIMLIASSAVSYTDNKKPVNGILITGRNFSQDLLRKISNATSLDLALYLPPQINNYSVLKKIFDNTKSNPDGSYIVFENNKTAYGYALLRDINNQSIGIIRLTIPREIYISGRETITYYLGAFLVLGLMLSILIWYLLRILIFSRLEYLNYQIRAKARR